MHRYQPIEEINPAATTTPNHRSPTQRYEPIGEDTTNNKYVLNIHTKWACKEFAGTVTCATPPPAPPSPGSGLYRCVDNGCVEVAQGIPGTYLKICDSFCGQPDSYQCVNSTCTPSARAGLNFTSCIKFCK